MEGSEQKQLRREMDARLLVSVPQAEVPEKEAAARTSVPQGRVTSVLSGRLWGDCFPPKAGRPISTQMSSSGGACGGDDGAQTDPGLGRM